MYHTEIEFHSCFWESWTCFENRCTFIACYKAPWGIGWCHLGPFLSQVSVPSTTLAHAESVWPCLYWCLYYDIFLLVPGLFAWDYWPIFSVACHLTPSSLSGVCAVVLMLPWFNGSLVWSKYSVVDPTYKAIAVAGYLCISVRWILYHIDTLSSCLLLP